MIRRDVLRVFATHARCFTGTKYCEACIAVSGLTIPGFLNITKNLIVSSVLFNDVDHMLNRRGIRKESGAQSSQQAVVAHDLLGITSQSRIVRNRNGGDVASDN